MNNKLVITNYLCQCCKVNKEQLRAKDNVPRYAHICRRCFYTLAGSATGLLNHYVAIDTDGRGSLPKK